MPFVSDWDILFAPFTLLSEMWRIVTGDWGYIIMSVEGVVTGAVL